MILLPFLFFSVLTVYWWHKHGGMDLCVYMSGLYTFICLIAIALNVFEIMGEGGILFDNDNYVFGVIPTLLFCLSIGLCLLPFSVIYTRDIKRITIMSPWSIDVFSWMLIAVAFLNLYLVADSTLDILQGDLAQIRKEHYAGMETPAQLKAETLPFIVKFFYYLNPSTILCLPILFFNLAFRNKGIVFNALLLFASLSCPVLGIQVVDRTEIVYWGLMLVFCLFFFYRFLSSRVRWSLVIAGIPIIVLAVVYLVAVSQARFDQRGSSGAGNRTAQYAGQGFLNFCYFYENGHLEYISPERELPFINHFVYHVDSNDERREERSGEQGFFISVFATFIGDIMLDLGIVGMMVWVAGYFLLTMLLLRRSHRDVFDISEVLLIYLLAIIPIFGIFYYRFFAFTNTFSFIFALGLLFLSKYKILLK